MHPTKPEHVPTVLNFWAFGLRRTALKPLVIVGLIASPAQADWQYAKWGETPDEVVEASSGKAHRVEAKQSGTIVYETVQLAAASHQAGSRIFDVKFIFRNNRLTSTNLTLLGEPLGCYALETDLTGLYGEPLSKSNGSTGDILSRNWSDRQHNNKIAFIFVTYSSRGCFVNYTPLQSEETSGL